MLWNNQRRTSNMFLWGTFTGLIGGMLFNNWLNNRTDNHHELNNQKGKKSTVDNHNSTEDHLFETFMNTPEDEVDEKVEKMNLKN